VLRRGFLTKERNEAVLSRSASLLLALHQVCDVVFNMHNVVAWRNWPHSSHLEMLQLRANTLRALVLPPIGWLEARGEVLGNDALLVCWDLQEMTLISNSKTLSVKDVSSFCDSTEKD
jgi:hypothetical protein